MDSSTQAPEIRTLLRRMPNTLRVGSSPGGMTEFVTIQDAIDYAATQTPTAASPWVVYVYPGTYTEEITMADYVSVVGVERNSVVVVATGGQTAFTMATESHLSTLTIKATADGGGNVLGIECNDRGFRLEEVRIDLSRSANTAYGIYESIAGTARTIYALNVVISGTDALTVGIYITKANKTFYFVGCFVEVEDAALRFLAAATDCVVWSDHSYWAGNSAFLVQSSSVTITLREDSIAGNRAFTHEEGTILILGGSINCPVVSLITGGSLVWKVREQEYHVMRGMIIGHAITAAAADTPTPAAAVPYVIKIGPGEYDEQITMGDYISLVGSGPDSTVILQTSTSVIGPNATDANLKDLTLRIVTPSVNGRTHVLVSEATPMLMENITFEITTPAGYQTRLVFSGAAATITMRRCRASIAGTEAAYLIWNNGAGCTFLLDNCDIELSSTHASAGVVVVDNTTAVIIIRNSRIGGSTAGRHLRALAGIIRLSNSQYRSVSRSGTGDIIDESPEAKSYAFHTVKSPLDVDIASATLATRTAVGGAVTSGGAGQVRLRINDDAVDAAGIENPADAAGSLDSSFTAGRSIRYCRQISVSVFRATTAMFFGLRATLGAAVPGVAEDHFGFDWDGTNFRAISSDGAGVGVQTNLTTPTVGVQIQLEAIQLRSGVEFYVDGVLVATHTGAGIPTAGGTLDFQEYQISDGLGAATTSDITLREGFLQECPA